VVKDADTGEPRPGVLVVLWLETGRLSRSLTATTDAEGRYEIRGARKATSYLLWVPADPALGNQDAQVKAEDTPWFEPVIADIAVKKGGGSSPK
jgi:hypothetical protein